MNKEIKTAGHFILGQSHKESFFKKPKELKNRTSLNKTTFSSTKYEELYFGEEWDSRDPFYKELNYEDLEGYFDEPFDRSRKKDTRFNPHSSFVGRLFNFNVWSYAKSFDSIIALYNDCKLSLCGNATQWSDFRQGTRGQVKMKWPTKLLWKSNIAFFSSASADLLRTFLSFTASN